MEPSLLWVKLKKKPGKHEDTKPDPTGGAGAHPHWERCPCSPVPIDELIAALREATLGPACPRWHRLDPFPDEDRRRPKVKILPPVFKGLPGERPDVHLLAAADWMEAMRLGPGESYR